MRLLDAEVAKWVFGRDITCFDRLRDAKDLAEEHEGPGRWNFEIEQLEKLHGPDLEKTIPRYSQSVELALEVVKKMRSLGYGFTLSTAKAGAFLASFTVDPVESGYSKLGGFCEAICLSAIEAQKGAEARKRKGERRKL